MVVYVKLEKVTHIIDLVMSDDKIKHKGKAIAKRLKELPGEDVEKVVRCKDCELFVNNEKAFVTYCKRECKNLYVKPNDFCSYGKRKEGAEE
jgi:hypothetical protein